MASFRPTDRSLPSERHAAGDEAGAGFPALHLLRILAAICIFAGHWTEPYLPDFFPQGQLAIDMFFMVEGYLAARLLGALPAASTAALVRDRVMHVCPIYLAALVAGFLAFAPYAFAGEGGWSVGLWLRALAAGSLLLPIDTIVVHGSVYPLNPPSWAIILELLGFAALAAATRRSPRRGALLLWLGGTLVLLPLVAVWHDPNMGWRAEHYWGGLPRMAFGFFGGALLHAAHRRSGVEAALPWPVALLVCAGFVGMQFLRIRFIGWPLVGIVTPLLVLLAASISAPGWLDRLGGWAGSRALAVYLLAFPIMIGWRLANAALAVPPAVAGSLLGFAAVLGTILCAAELWVRAAERVARAELRHAPAQPGRGAEMRMHPTSAIGWRSRRLLLLQLSPVVAMIGLLLGTRLPGEAAATAESLDLRRYVLAFDEPFDRLDVSAWGPSTRWIAHTPWDGDFGDARFADPGPDGPFRVKDGLLTITMEKVNGRWRSGLLASSDRDGHGFMQSGGGYFEMRARLPGGAGVWPAFWLGAVGKPGERTPEIDIMEYYGHNPAAYTATTHVWMDGRGLAGEVRKIDVAPGSLVSGFHRYGARIDKDWVVFYLDRREVARVASRPEYLKPMFLMLDLGAGGGWPIDRMPERSVMTVDYVRAYRLR